MTRPGNGQMTRTVRWCAGRRRQGEVEREDTGEWTAAIDPPLNEFNLSKFLKKENIYVRRSEEEWGGMENRIGALRGGCTAGVINVDRHQPNLPSFLIFLINFIFTNPIS